MTADDLTRLRAVEFTEILAEHWQWEGTVQPQCQCGEPMPDIDASQITVAHRVHVASVLASSPTVAALIDRVERAERERDEFRAGIKGVLDTWKQEWSEWNAPDWSAGEECLRALLTEGADDE